MILRARRHVAPGRTTTSSSAPRTATSRCGRASAAAFFAVFIMVSSISAMVGGIVIMNVMLVSVTERTKEIGVRRAVGATAVRHPAAVSDRERDAVPGRRHRSVSRSASAARWRCATFTAFPASVQTWVAVLGVVLSSASACSSASIRRCRRSQARSGGGAEGGVSVMTRAAESSRNLLVALDTLRSRKVRSALTVLGIVIGVTSVICGRRHHRRARTATSQGRITSHRLAHVLHLAHPARHRSGRLPEKIRMRKYLRVCDAHILKEHCPRLDFATAFADRINFGASGRTTSATATSASSASSCAAPSPSMAAAIPLFAVATGASSRPTRSTPRRRRHRRRHRRFAVPARRSARQDGPAERQALRSDRRLRARSRPVRRLRRGSVRRHPASRTFTRTIRQIREVFLAVHRRATTPISSVARNEVVEAHAPPPPRAARARRTISRSPIPIFLTTLWDQLTGALALLTGVISSIGLLVGGIGVMNIMLISVTERTGEIGIRKAIGARKSDIRVQFLLEAVTLSGLGGVIGILLGALIAFMSARSFPASRQRLASSGSSLGVAISVGVGLFFGYYPANRAANLDPIVCLRYE